MYLVEVNKATKKLSEFDNTQLVCSYLFLRRTFNYLYKEKLRKLDRKQKRAIVYDISLFEKIKNTKYLLRTSSPQKWLEDSEIYNKIVTEIEKRELSINNLDFC
jgi:hypothetical protein